MLCTPAILDFPLTFAREAKRFIESRTERVLWNYVDKRNTVHIKLLKFLGFTFLEEVPFGPNQLTFIRFERWHQSQCLNNWQRRAKGCAGIAGSIGSQNDAVAQARAQNEAMMNQYKHRSRIRDKQYKDTQQIYATKLNQYNQQMTAADRAASRAYGIEQYNQSQRLKQAAFQGLRLDRALATSQVAEQQHQVRVVVVPNDLT